MKDTAVLVTEMVVAFLIVDILKDYCKAAIRWAWSEAVATWRYLFA